MSDASPPSTDSSAEGGPNISSSNRTGGVCDAVVVQHQRPSGPVRLPLSSAIDFVAQFNRIYQGTGMSLIAMNDNGSRRSQTSIANEKIPDDSSVTGDF